MHVGEALRYTCKVTSKCLREKKFATVNLWTFCVNMFAIRKFSSPFRSCTKSRVYKKKEFQTVYPHNEYDAMAMLLFQVFSTLYSRTTRFYSRGLVTPIFRPTTNKHLRVTSQEWSRIYMMFLHFLTCHGKLDTKKIFVLLIQVSSTGTHDVPHRNKKHQTLL